MKRRCKLMKLVLSITDSTLQSLQCLLLRAVNRAIWLRQLFTRRPLTSRMAFDYTCGHFKWPRAADSRPIGLVIIIMRMIYYINDVSVELNSHMVQFIRCPLCVTQKLCDRVQYFLMSLPRSIEQSWTVVHLMYSLQYVELTRLMYFSSIGNSSPGVKCGLKSLDEMLLCGMWVFHAYLGSCPSYISKVVSATVSSSAHRSLCMYSGTNFIVPRTSNRLAERALSVVGPMLGNWHLESTFFCKEPCIILSYCWRFVAVFKA